MLLNLAVDHTLDQNAAGLTIAEMPRLKNCWACGISSGSRTFKGGGGTRSAEGASFLGGLGACTPRNF